MEGGKTIEFVCIFVDFKAVDIFPFCLALTITKLSFAGLHGWHKHDVDTREESQPWRILW